MRGVCKRGGVEVREKFDRKIGDFIAIESNITRYPEKYNIKISLMK